MTANSPAQLSDGNGVPRGLRTSWSPVRGPGRSSATLAGGLWLLLYAVSTRRTLARRDRDLRLLRAELAELRRGTDALIDRLRAEARRDSLTGLGNRRRWQEELPQEIERARRSGTGLAVALLDVDRLKEVNDSAGHRAGDDLLQAVARGLDKQLRTVDLTARIGGDEFAAALPDISAETAREALGRLRAALPSGATCSIGLALWDGEESADDLVRRADEALYRAKNNGRDQLNTA